MEDRVNKDSDEIFDELIAELDDHVAQGNGSTNAQSDTPSNSVYSRQMEQADIVASVNDTTQRTQNEDLPSQTQQQLPVTSSLEQVRQVSKTVHPPEKNGSDTNASTSSGYVQTVATGIFTRSLYRRSILVGVILLLLNMPSFISMLRHVPRLVTNGNITRFGIIAQALIASLLFFSIDSTFEMLKS